MPANANAKWGGGHRKRKQLRTQLFMFYDYLKFKNSRCESSPREGEMERNIF